jgi:hypothetical protein
MLSEILRNSVRKKFFALAKISFRGLRAVPIETDDGPNAGFF